MAISLKKEPNLSAKHDAFSYQLQAVEAIKNLEYAAIFHEQGLGKSKIAVDLLLYWLAKGEVDTVLLVAKKGLIANWQRELKVHSHLKPRVLSGDRKQNFFTFNSPTRLILAHYESIKAEKSRLKLFLKTRRVGVILDEATKIKNPESAISQALFELAPLFSRRIIMTGTPVANRPYDIWAQIKFLDDGKALGGNFEEFKRQTDLSNELGHSATARAEFESTVASIHNRLSAFTVRETKDGKIIQLPDKEFRTRITDWESRQYDLYMQVKNDTRAIIVRDGLLTEDRADDAIKRLLRLVQIASNPRLVDESYTVNPGKWSYLEEIINEAISSGEKSIVWTSFTENADWLTGKLRSHGAEKVHGKMTLENRNRSVRLFIEDPDVRVLVATPGAAKEGLTLTVANNVIFYDRGFSLDDYLQAQDRIHRVSQTKTCYIYNLIMQDSIDEWIDVLLRAKHIAAQLAQGDISLDQYQAQMSYSYGEIVRGILGLEEKK